MLRIGKVILAFGFVLLLPVVASAQATISGVVKDASGAVLPGVTVEASSPALIEKVRTTVTDGTGQYAIPDLRPGIYSVKFTLTGFAAVEREGVELSGTFTARINPSVRSSVVFMHPGCHDAGFPGHGFRTSNRSNRLQRWTMVEGTAHG